MCDCDLGYAPDVFTSSNHKARKPYKCCECGGGIKPGEEYENNFGVWEGEPNTFKRCLACVALCIALADFEDDPHCGGPSFGGAWWCLDAEDFTAEQLAKLKPLVAHWPNAAKLLAGRSACEVSP